MQRILKFEAPSPGIDFTHSIPMGAKFLDLQIQNGRPQMWFLCYTEARPQKRKFKIFATGEHVPDIYTKYIGTYQKPPFVWHVLEIPEG